MATASDRVVVRDLGKSTLGNPFLLIIITAPAGCSRIEVRPPVSSARAKAFRHGELYFYFADPATALKEAANIVITDEMAQKYFGSEEPIGKVIQFRRRFPLQVAGVIKKMPRNSHFHADFIGSIRQGFWRVLLRAEQGIYFGTE